MKSRLDIIRRKILEPGTLVKKIHGWRVLGHKVVFTNGCFDLVHLGHIEYLAKASDLGDHLIIGLNSDRSVSAIKGNSRPIIDQHSRAMLLASFVFVSAVTIFDEDTPYELIKLAGPDVLVKGNDWKEEDIIGADLVKARGGSIQTVELVSGYSTSLIEKKIRASKN